MSHSPYPCRLFLALRAKRTGLLALLALLPLLGASGPRPGERLAIRVVEHSALMIHGTTNVNRFTCTYHPVGQLVPVSWMPRSADDGTEMATGLRATLSVPTDCFDCGHRKMNADFQEALKADLHPDVRITLESASWDPSPEEHLPVVAHTRITIAGVTREVTLQAEWHRCPDGCLQVTARKDLAMSDFGIERPTALLGMVRTDDAIAIELDLHVVIDSAQAER
jgi:hypothetical protein